MISFRNINFVYNRVRNNCHNKTKIFEFTKYKNCNLIDILEKLHNENYIFSNFSIFLIHEKKYRIIMSENISDKIVNQLISYFILVPSFKCLIDTNIATRKDKGTSYGYDLFNKYVNSIGIDKNIYVLRIDISKYFYNIDHEILYDMLTEKIKDERSLKVLREIISLTNREYVNQRIKYLINNEIKRINKLKISQKEKDRKIAELQKIPLYEYGKGLSIGCLSNQLFAIFFLNNIDHYIKETLKHKYYIRYMDDLYILDTDKEKLKLSLDLIEKELNKIKLSINNKSGIYKLSEGISFLGYTYFFKNNKLIVKYNNDTIKRIDRKLKKNYYHDFNSYYSSLNSYKGYFTKSNTKLLETKYEKMIIKNRYDKYRILKERFFQYVIFIKNKDKYYTYGKDLIIVRKFIKLKYNCLNQSKFNKVIKRIEKYVVLEGNDVRIVH